MNLASLDQGALLGGDAALLYRRPGFLLRRCHQIAVAIFVESCRREKLTPGQFGSLFLIACYPGIDQRTLADRIGLDRSTTGAIVNRLAQRRLIRRHVRRGDRRSRALALSALGRRLLADARRSAGEAQRRLLSPLALAEQTILLQLLTRLVVGHAAVSRAPFRPLLDAGLRPARKRRPDMRAQPALAGGTS